MFKTAIERVEAFSEENLRNSNLLLWVWYADKIPPHIGCSINGFYFSLKANGRDFMIPVHKVEKIVQKKSIPFLLIETNMVFDLPELENAYNKYFQASAHGVSCLRPILDLIKTPSEIEYLKHLIHHLESTERIKHIFGINLNADYSGLKEYGQLEIMDRLRKLSHAKREENISEGR